MNTKVLPKRFFLDKERRKLQIELSNKLKEDFEAWYKLNELDTQTIIGDILTLMRPNIYK